MNPAPRRSHHNLCVDSSNLLVLLPELLIPQFYPLVFRARSLQSIFLATL
jgi:hypothetical protein